MRILLVYPEMPDTFYAMRHFMKIVNKKATYPPLGLMTVAALLPQHWEKKLADLNVKPLTNDDIMWADFVFLSAMNVQEESVHRVIKQCKECGAKIVAGGSLFTHEYYRFNNIDHFVLNEAEITLPLFLEDLEKQQLKPIYQTNEFADITTSPLPMFDLIDTKHYLYAIVQYSRGCPFMCDFCDVTALLGRKQRTKSPDQIIAELEAINKTKNIQLVLFADDNLIGNKKILKSELLPALIEWRKKANPKFYFATQLTINIADDEELMHLLIDAGFRHVFIGIETPSEEGLKGAHKNQNLKRDLLSTVNKIHEKGFIISAGFIVGFDTDDQGIFQRQINFIQESGIPLPIVNIMKAPPGTDLFKRIKSENRLSKEFAFFEGDTNIIPRMDEKLLYQGFIEVIDNVYTPEKSYERLIQFFKTYRFPKNNLRIQQSFGFDNFVYALLLFYKLGILDENRKYFWKLIFWSIKNNKKMIDKSFFYSIMIHQMHQTYKIVHKKALLELDRLSKKNVPVQLGELAEAV